MGLEDVGVRFVSEGYAQFMTQIGDASLAIINMGKSMTQNKLQALQILDGMMKTMGDSATSYATSAQGAATANEVLVQSFKELATFSQKPSLKNVFGGIFEGIGG